MMSNLLKNRKGNIAKLIVAFLLVGFFAPVNIAFATSVVSGLAPSVAGPGNDNCFVARASGISVNHSYCYPTPAACATARATAVSPAVATECITDWSKKSLTETTVAGKGGFMGDIISAIGEKVTGVIGDVLLSPIVGLAFLFFTFAGLFLSGMGALLDIAISSTINSEFYSGLTVINIGWTAVRDFSNMFFIFVLLLIAIKTILGLAGSSTKRWVAHLIIAAVMINFSLFATKVVIDAGNILAWGFWERMQVTAGGVSGPSATMTLLEGFKLQSIADPKDSAGNEISLPSTTKIMIYLGGGLFMFIAGYVLLAGAIMMILRTVTLIMLMITSPFAFLGFGLPGMGGFASKWFSRLIGSAFVAPAFIAMLYLVSTIINSPDLFKLTNSSGLTYGAALAGDISSIAIIYNYVLMIILVLASLTVANEVSNGAGTKASAWAKKGLGGAGAAGALGFGVVGRQTLGRGGRAAMNNEKWVKEQNRLVARAGMKDATIIDKMRGRGANAQIATMQKLNKGTYDVRNASVMGKNVNSALGYGGVNVGQGSKRNFEQQGAALSSVSGGYRGADKEKELIATAKERFKGDPAAQEAYLRRTLGKSDFKGTDTYDATRHKDLRTQMEREKVTVEAKSNLKKAIDPKAEGAIIGEAAAEAIKKNLALLSGKEAAEILGDKPEYLKNPALIAALTSKELSALDTTKLDAEQIKSLSTGIVQNGTESARNHLKNQAKIGGVLQYDSAAELKRLTEDYNEKEVSLKTNDAAWQAYEKTQKEEINKALGMVGSATNIAELDDDLIAHKAIVSQYNAKTVREFQKKIKDGDIAGDFGEKLDKQLKEYSTRGTKNTTPTTATTPKTETPKGPSPIATPTGDEVGKYGRQA